MSKTALTQKWSELIAEHGYTQVPNLLLQSQAALHITTSELCILLQILSYKWTPRHPYPSVKRLSTQSGLAQKTVRNNIARLENKGLLKRIYRANQSSLIDFEPLIEKLNLIAPIRAARRPKMAIRGSPNLATKEEKLRKKTIKRRGNFTNNRSEPLRVIIERRYEKLNH